LRDRRARAIKQDTPSLGHLDAARLAAKELNAELGFDCLDPLAKRRLLHAEPLGSPRDVTFLGNGDELTEVAQLDSHT
jgi:hypothetical protein